MQWTWRRLWRRAPLPLPFSVECERAFHKMNLINTELRNSLGDEHLEVCMRLGSSRFTYQNYPRERAMQLWRDGKERRGVEMLE